MALKLHFCSLRVSYCHNFIKRIGYQTPPRCFLLLSWNFLCILPRQHWWNCLKGIVNLSNSFKVPGQWQSKAWHVKVLLPLFFEFKIQKLNCWSFWHSFLYLQNLVKCHPCFRPCHSYSRVCCLHCESAWTPVIIACGYIYYYVFGCCYGCLREKKKKNSKSNNFCLNGCLRLRKWFQSTGAS